MSEVRCQIKANYKAVGMNFFNLAVFDVWLPEEEAVRLLNDPSARERLFRMHYPSATEISGTIFIGLHERRG